LSLLPTHEEVLADLVARRTGRVPRGEVDRAGYVGPGDIEPGGFLAADRPSDGALPRTCVPFTRGDVLVATSQPAAARMWLADRDGVCSPSLLVLRSTSLPPAYLAHLLRAPRVVAAMIQASGTDLRLSYPRLRRVRVAVHEDPDVDRVAAGIDAVRDLLRTAREAEGVTRQIVPRLLAGVVSDADRRRVPLSRYVAAFRPGRSPKTFDRSAGPGELAVIRNSAVSSGAFIASENKALLPGFRPPPETLIHRHDLLLLRSNNASRFGWCARVEEEPAHPLMRSDRVWRVEPQQGVSTDFIQALLAAPSARRALREAAGGTTDLVNIGQRAALDLPVPSVEPDEQARLAAAVGGLRRLQRLQARRSETLDDLVRHVGARLFAGRVGTAPMEQAPPEAPDAALWRHLSDRQERIREAAYRAGDAFGVTRVSALLGQTEPPDAVRRTLDLLVLLGGLVSVDGSMGALWRRTDADADVVTEVG
jgi:hypothetical protein